MECLVCVWTGFTMEEGFGTVCLQVRCLDPALEQLTVLLISICGMNESRNQCEAILAE